MPNVSRQWSGRTRDAKSSADDNLGGAGYRSLAGSVGLVAAGFAGSFSHMAGYAVALAIGAALACRHVLAGDARRYRVALFVTALLSLQILRMGYRHIVGVGDWLWLFIAALATVVVALTREPFGYIGMVATLVPLGMVAFHLRRGVRLRQWHCCSGRHRGVDISGQHHRLAIRISSKDAGRANQYRRSLARHRAQSLCRPRHSANSFGIKWDDKVGDRAFQAVSPNAGYVTDEYYRVIRNLRFA